MELATTYRGLNERESGLAARTLERHLPRLERLVDKPTTLRAVVEGPSPEYRVHLELALPGSSLSAEDHGHDLGTAITNASERMRAQVVRVLHRRESQRHRVDE
ncbi:MAG: HPF/RaiA family ribosome-associated protein [Deltaproteobacteria bacterium]|nr:HPF/RaiA family ribosome-associated protein [Deltaproteobacteria bacterium]